MRRLGGHRCGEMCHLLSDTMAFTVDEKRLMGRGSQGVWYKKAAPGEGAAGENRGEEAGAC